MSAPEAGGAGNDDDEFRRTRGAHRYDAALRMCPDARFALSHFTGKERDPESGLDYFYARCYSSILGRFMTPDWAAAPTAVPYATFGNPQTLNLYAYVNNNPNTGIDLDGHVGTGGSDAAAADMAAEATENSAADASAGNNNATTQAGQDAAANRSGATTDSGQNKKPATPGTKPKPAPPNPSPRKPGQTAASDNKNKSGNQQQNQAPPQPQTLQEHNKAQIAAESAAFNACVKQALKKAGGDAVIDTFTHKETTSGAAKNVGDAFFDAENECLSQHPYAALSPDYQGLPPGDDLQNEIIRHF